MMTMHVYSLVPGAKRPEIAAPQVDNNAGNVTMQKTIAHRMYDYLGQHREAIGRAIAAGIGSSTASVATAARNHPELFERRWEEIPSEKGGIQPGYIYSLVPGAECPYQQTEGPEPASRRAQFLTENERRQWQPWYTITVGTNEMTCTTCGTTTQRYCPRCEDNGTMIATRDYLRPEEIRIVS